MDPDGLHCKGRCRCAATGHTPRLVVVTGGPGAGKTALLELVRRDFCEHVAVLPESASILFGGGFPRAPSLASRRAAQRAIFHVQRELERQIVEPASAGLTLCDRGTIDGAAYWPGDLADFWRELGTSREAEHARYTAVIHLRTPPPSHYNHRNPLRTETAAQAAELDARIAEVWRGHPRLFVVEERDRFFDKVQRAIAIIRDELPACCRAQG